MTPALQRVMRRMAVILDLMKAHTPPGYERNIVLVNTADAKAHIFVGESDPRKLADAVSELIDDPAHCGIANADGVEIEI